MTVKFVKGEVLVLAKNEPKIVGKGFTVSNSYAILDIQKAKHGVEMIEEEYAILESDLKVKTAFWKSGIMESFANKEENLQTQVMNAPVQVPPLPQAPLPVEIPSIPTAPVQTKYITIAELDASKKEAEYWKLESEASKSIVKELEIDIAGYQKELASKGIDTEKQIFAGGIGAIGIISSLKVVDKLAIITLVKAENGTNTISVKIDNHPNLTVSSEQPFHVLDEGLASLISDAYNPNMIRIQSIQQFTADLEKLEKTLKKEISKISDPKPEVEKPKGRGKAVVAGKLEMSVSAPEDDSTVLPPLEDNDMPPMPGVEDEAVLRMKELDQREF